MKSSLSPIQPTTADERADILDILRGIALLGIIVANYAMFSLYIFQPIEKARAMPTATIDYWIGWIHFIFIDGKFYSIFSLLFGIGFSIILKNAAQKGKKGLTFFYRRIFVLMLIGLAHLLLLWEGDIVMLYALIGLLLPLFRNFSNRALIITAVGLLLLPIAIDLVKILTDNRINMSHWFTTIGRSMDKEIGVTEKNFSTWLVDHKNYSDLLAYNRVGVVYRYQMLLENNRVFKVLAMFLIGLYVGRNLIYAKLQENKTLFKKLQGWGFVVGLPISVFHAWLEMNGKRLPAIEGWYNTISYAFSVVPLSLAYTATICLWYLNNPHDKIMRVFAKPGRMALTNYISQTIFGIAIFYGIGLGLGAKTGVLYVWLIAIAIYLLLMFLSQIWLKYFNYGPLEWVWRMITYGKWLTIAKNKLPRGDKLITPN